jgi:lactate dehydrogenase-like 2-hydroxyacid dehydrogenase
MVQGMVSCNLWADSSPIPEGATLEISADGQVNENYPENPQKLFREVHTGIIMSPHVAIAIGDFISNQGKLILEQIQAAQAQTDESKSE